jgi:hypothetical protein
MDYAGASAAAGKGNFCRGNGMAVASARGRMARRRREGGEKGVAVRGDKRAQGIKGSDAGRGEGGNGLHGATASTP